MLKWILILNLFRFSSIFFISLSTLVLLVIFSPTSRFLILRLATFYFPYQFVNTPSWYMPKLSWTILFHLILIFSTPKPFLIFFVSNTIPHVKIKKDLQVSDSTNLYETSVKVFKNKFLQAWPKANNIVLMQIIHSKLGQ